MNEVGELLSELNCFLLNEFSNKIDEEWDEKRRNTVYREMAKKNFDEMNVYKQSLKDNLSKDMKKLYQINTFFEKDKNKKLFPLYKKEYSSISDGKYFSS